MNNVIIVAGGKGLRMGQELPKQFISIGGKPILMHTIEAFFRFDNLIHIVVVIHPSYREYWSQLCEQYKFNIKHKVIDGGDTRFHSVKNGLELVEKGIVAVHDAARPFVSLELINRCFKEASKYKSIIPVLEVTDSLREICSENKSKIANRALFRTVQTPQVFDVDLLKKAYTLDFDDIFTDDASVVEALGYDVHLVAGERKNIKITTPFDLELASILIDDGDKTN